MAPEEKVTSVASGLGICVQGSREWIKETWPRVKLKEEKHGIYLAKLRLQWSTCKALDLSPDRVEKRSV